MAKIFWLEDQFHWIDKFENLLISSDFGDGSQSNELEIHKFVESASKSIKQNASAPDIAILDANMNGVDEAGLSIAKKIASKWPETPIIYLSEHSGTDIEEAAFEESQAKDFIAKHQRNIEKVLCWRIKALMRDKQIRTSQDCSTHDRIVSGNLTIDLTTWNVYWHGTRLMNPNNPQRPLAPTPRKILRYLVQAAPSAVSTESMAGKLDSEKFNYPSYRQHIKTLRHSFEQACIENQSESFIETCKQGKGIVTFGDEGAYLWKKI